jgi:hypothetical protein
METVAADVRLTGQPSQTRELNFDFLAERVLPVWFILIVPPVRQDP